VREFESTQIFVRNPYGRHLVFLILTLLVTGPSSLAAVIVLLVVPVVAEFPARWNHAAEVVTVAAMLLPAIALTLRGYLSREKHKHGRRGKLAVTQTHLIVETDKRRSFLLLTHARVG
jgi:uncharacterized membrane protein YbhN (UPF0104 family)